MDIAEKLPPEFRDSLGVMHGQAETFLKHSEHVRSDFSSSTMDSSSNFQSHLTNEGIDTRESTSQHSIDNGLKSPPSSRQSTDGEAELVEQFEPGVYITFIQLKNDIKMFKRVRFSKRRFAEQQAEDWWNKNKERVFKKYSYPGQATTTLPTSAPNEEEDATPSS
uniref:BRX domain-containing protein n=2 Tax=Musa acuminata TaxID=4641 RepID=A0A804JQA2_MUSAM|nr:PREDICTED: protein Brevis radix-like 1 [Musa acuminata subsp. malaccensis]